MIEANEALFERVIGLAIEVHRILGPGLLESIYELALCQELLDAGISYEQQKEIEVRYKGRALGIGFRIDILVQSCLVLEIKAVEQLTHLHAAQIINYLKLLRIKRGLILSFNSAPLRRGIKRISI